MKIIASNTDVANEIEHMAALVRAGGGYLHDDIVIREDAGNLWVEGGPTVEPKAKLATLSADCLIPVDCFDLESVGDEIVVRGQKHSTTERQLELMKSTAKLYNLTGKLASFRQCATQNLIQTHPELYKYLLGGTMMQKGGGNLDDGDLLNRFLNTREISLPSNEYGFCKEVTNDGGRAQVIMPVIDFINHTTAASGFIAKSGELSVHFNPDLSTGGRESFVSYGAYDALNMLLAYSYADTVIPILTSIPMVLDLGNLGKIRIRRVEKRNKQAQIPKVLENIKPLVPEFWYNENERLMGLSFLRVPPTNRPRALRRILSFVLNMMNPGARLQEINQAVDQAEWQVIDNNIGFYEKMRTLAEEASASDPSSVPVKNALTVSGHQLGLLQQYSFEKSRS